MMLLNNHGFRMEPKISVAGWDSVILQNDWLRDFWNEGLQKKMFYWKILASPFSEPPLFFHLPAGLCRKDWVLCKGMVWRDLPLVAATVVSLMGRSGTTAFATQSFCALWHSYRLKMINIWPHSTTVSFRSILSEISYLRPFDVQLWHGELVLPRGIRLAGYDDMDRVLLHQGKPLSSADFFCSIDIIATRIPVILPLNIIRFLFLYIIIIHNPIIPVILPFNIIKAPFFICFSMIWGDDDWWCPVLCDEATAKTCGTGDFAECVALTEARLPRGLIGVDWVTMGWTDFVAWDDGIEPGEFQKFQKSESAKLRTNAQRFAPPNSRLAGFPTTTPKAPEKRKNPTALEISIGWSWLRI